MVRTPEEIRDLVDRTKHCSRGGQEVVEARGGGASLLPSSSVTALLLPGRYGNRDHEMMGWFTGGRCRPLPLLPCLEAHRLRLRPPRAS